MTLVVGVGLRAGTSYDELRTLVDTALADAGAGEVQTVITVSGRETEPAVQRLVVALSADLTTVSPQELSRQAVPTPSDQVNDLTGTPSVAEAAVLTTGATLVIPKRRSANATVAVGRLPAPGYAAPEREVVHRVIAERRDVRRGFLDLPIDDEVLTRVLEAAHRAPSVGLSQPWDFVLIRDVSTRRRVHELASAQRDAFAESLPPDRRDAFDGLKIEAILDTPLNIAVTCDPGRGGRHVLGRHADPRTVRFSAAIAIQNLWLAARAEGLGVGWVSFFEPDAIAAVLGLPAYVELVGYLCVGQVEEFAKAPELVRTGWAQRRPLAWAVHHEEWGRRDASILDDAVASGQSIARAMGKQRVRVFVDGDPAIHLQQADSLVVSLSEVQPPAGFGVLWRPARTAVEAVELGVEVARDLAMQGVGEIVVHLVKQSERADGMVRGLRAGASACGVACTDELRELPDSAP